MTVSSEDILRMSGLAKELGVRIEPHLLAWLGKHAIIGGSSPADLSVAIAMVHAEQLCVLFTLLEFKEGTSKADGIDAYLKMVGRISKIGLGIDGKETA